MGYKSQSTEIQQIISLINAQYEQSKELFMAIEGVFGGMIYHIEKPIAFGWICSDKGDMLAIGDNRNMAEGYSELNKHNIPLKNIDKITVEIVEMYGEINFNIYIRFNEECEMQIHSLQ